MAIKSKKGKVNARGRTKFRIRKRIASSSHPRISIFRSSKYTYAQIISDKTGETLVSASSKESEVQAEVAAIAKEFEAAHKKQTEGNAAEAVGSTINSTRSPKGVAAALAVGSVLAKRAIAKQVTDVVFDRNGYLYHGRVKAVAEGARLRGLKF